MAVQSQYATTDNIQALSITPAMYATFTNDGQEEAPVIAQLQAASSLCDMYLSEQFILPVLEWDMQLTKVTCDIAAYYLYVQFGFNPNSETNKIIEQRYDKAMEWLLKVSRKELHPLYKDSDTSPGDPAAGPFVISDTPVGFGGPRGVF